MAGLLRTPATVAIYRTRRTCARPPQIQRLPRIFPLSRLNGARPASAAICLRLSIPSSGNCASRVLESTLPTPGTERSNSSRSRHKGVSRINSASSASRPESRFSNQRMCSSMLRCKTLGARARRFFSAVSISINWRRRVTSASSAWACASANGRASGRTASPKRASTSASSRSVLASLPVARAKSRTCRGLTIATGIPAAARAPATGVSRPPVASTITKSAGFICLSNSWIPTSSLATEKAPPADPMNTSSATLATSIPTNRFTSSMFHPPQRGLPRLAIRDFFPLQPFGLSAIGEAATLAARRDLAPKGAPVCRSTNSDSSTKSSTYKGVEKLPTNRDDFSLSTPCVNLASHPSKVPLPVQGEGKRALRARVRAVATCRRRCSSGTSLATAGLFDPPTTSASGESDALSPYPARCAAERSEAFKVRNLSEVPRLPESTRADEKPKRHRDNSHLRCGGNDPHSMRDPAATRARLATATQSHDAQRAVRRNRDVAREQAGAHRRRRRTRRHVERHCGALRSRLRQIPGDRQYVRGALRSHRHAARERKSADYGRRHDDPRSDEYRYRRTL